MSHGDARTAGPIVLVGFMAAGKTTVGAGLADRLGWPFVDLDARIEERTGRSPGALIRERGEDEFRALEAALTAELAGLDRVVFAPGGGWVTRPELLSHLALRTTRVWLRVSAPEAVRRAEAEGTDRPLLGPPAGRLERAARLLEERRPLYQQAEVVVDVDGREPGDVVDEIVRRLGFREANER